MDTEYTVSELMLIKQALLAYRDLPKLSEEQFEIAQNCLNKTKLMLNNKHGIAAFKDD